MLQRFDGAVGVDALGDEAAGGGDFCMDLRHRVGRAGGHAGVGGVEHVEVVVSVADGEAVGGRKLVNFGDFSKTAAFVEITVPEAQVD